MDPDAVIEVGREAEKWERRRGSILTLPDPPVAAAPLGLFPLPLELELALELAPAPWFSQIMVHAEVLRHTISVKRSGRIRKRQAISKAVPIMKIGQYCSR